MDYNIEELLAAVREELEDDDLQAVYQDMLIIEQMMNEADREHSVPGHMAYPVFNALMLSFSEGVQLCIIEYMAKVQDFTTMDEALDEMSKLSFAIALELHKGLRVAYRLGQRADYDIVTIPCEGHHD